MYSNVFFLKLVMDRSKFGETRENSRYTCFPSGKPNNFQFTQCFI